MVYKLDCRGWSLLQIGYGISKSSDCSIIGDLRERALAMVQILRRGDGVGSRVVKLQCQMGGGIFRCPTFRLTTFSK
jgi:hypothetical protein